MAYSPGDYPLPAHAAEEPPVAAKIFYNCATGECYPVAAEYFPVILWPNECIWIILGNWEY